MMAQAASRTMKPTSAIDSKVCTEDQDGPRQRNQLKEHG